MKKSVLVIVSLLVFAGCAERSAKPENNVINCQEGAPSWLSEHGRFEAVGQANIGKRYNDALRYASDAARFELGRSIAVTLNEITESTKEYLFSESETEQVSEYKKVVSKMILDVDLRHSYNKYTWKSNNCNELYVLTVLDENYEKELIEKIKQNLNDSYAKTVDKYEQPAAKNAKNQDKMARELDKRRKLKQAANTISDTISNFIKKPKTTNQ